MSLIERSARDEDDAAADETDAWISRTVVVFRPSPPSAAAPPSDSPAPTSAAAISPAPPRMRLRPTRAVIDPAVLRPGSASVKAVLRSAGRSWAAGRRGGRGGAGQ